MGSNQGPNEQLDEQLRTVKYDMGNLKDMVRNWADMLDA